MKKVLIIQTASIGDVVLSTPLIESFHEAGWITDMMVKHSTACLFANHPYIHNLWQWNKSERKYRNLFHLIRIIRKEKYDVVVNLQRFFSTGLVVMMSGACKKIGFSKNPLSIFYSEKFPHNYGTFENPIHEVDRNLSLISGLIPPIRKVKLYPGSNDFDFVNSFATLPFVCIAPASLWATKTLPVETWTSLSKEISMKKIVYLIGSKDDIPLCEVIINAVEKTNVINLAGKLSLLQTAAIMSKADMNFTNDSAPMHLASAMNAPVCAVFCSTIPEFGFGPLSDKKYIVQANIALLCKPCGIHGHKTCPEQHFNCAKKITTEDLLTCLN
jgi:heptosyltransferase-2